MKRSILVFAFLITLVGCVSKPTKQGDRTIYRLDDPLSWTASTPLGPRTIWIDSGFYVAIFEDEEGVYLAPPNGKIRTGKDGREEWYGGVYLPFDAGRGLNIYQGGGSGSTIQVLSPVGLLPVKVPDQYFRMKLWSPPELVTRLKKTGKEANQ